MPISFVIEVLMAPWNVHKDPRLFAHVSHRVLFIASCETSTSALSTSRLDCASNLHLLVRVFHSLSPFPNCERGREREQESKRTIQVPSQGWLKSLYAEIYCLAYAFWSNSVVTESMFAATG